MEHPQHITLCHPTGFQQLQCCSSAHPCTHLHMGETTAFPTALLVSACGSFGDSRDFEGAQDCLILGVFFAAPCTKARLAAGSLGTQDSWMPVIPFAGSTGLILAEP